MKGSPLLRAAFTLCVLLALSWPLSVITRPVENGASPAQESPVASAPSAGARLPLQMTFSRPAKNAELLYSGKRIWFAERPPASVYVTLDIPFPQEGVELEARAQWEDEEQSALRLQLTTPQGDEIDRSVWARQTLQAIVPFP